MRPVHKLLTLFIVLLVSSCLIIPPAKGPNEEPNPDEQPPPADQPTVAEEPPARDEEPPPPPPAPPKEVDVLVKELGPGKWIHLGHKTPAFSEEAGKVKVTRSKGGFSKLALIVADAGMEVHTVAVVFGNGDRWDPGVRASFKAGSRTRVIDLPGRARHIKHVAFRYMSTNKDVGQANLHLFGKFAPITKKKAGEPEPKPEPKPGEPKAEPAPDRSANLDAIKAELGPGDWKLLGSRVAGTGALTVDMALGEESGAFKFIAVASTGAEMDLTELVVTFPDGKVMSPKVKHRFKPGAHTRRLSFGGGRKVLKSVKFTINSRDPDKSATIHLYGRP